MKPSLTKYLNNLSSITYRSFFLSSILILNTLYFISSLKKNKVNEHLLVLQQHIKDAGKGRKVRHVQCEKLFPF